MEMDKCLTKKKSENAIIWTGKGEDVEACGRSVMTHSEQGGRWFAPAPFN